MKLTRGAIVAILSRLVQDQRRPESAGTRAAREASMITRFERSTIEQHDLLSRIKNFFHFNLE